MVCDFFIEYQKLLLNCLYMLISLPFILQLSLWMSPGHRLEYEESNLELTDYNESQQRSIIHVRESICLLRYIYISLISILIMAIMIVFVQFSISRIQDELIKTIVAKVTLFSNFLLILLLLFVGIIIEKIYEGINSVSESTDLLKTLDKKIVLYMITLVLLFSMLNLDVFIIIFGVFTGKFIWIDTSLEFSKEKFKKLVSNQLSLYKIDHIRRETIVFSAALSTSSIIEKILRPLMNFFSWVSIIPILVILIWYNKVFRDMFSSLANNFKNLK